MKTVNDYIETNKQKFLDELFEGLRIPSISAESSHKADMESCARWLAESLRKAGAEISKVMPSSGNPVVFAQKIIDSSKPTVLIYGHYDVMPVDPIELWTSHPFEPTVRNGRICARGANDDKGQLFMHVKAFEAMVATNSLPCNVKFMIEGEEEIGSPSLGVWCEQNKQMLASDVILISDTSLLSWDTPSITCGLRGLCYMEVDVIGPNKDLHSGLYGGAVANPINVLSQMISSLVDNNGQITIPHFYDNVRVLNADERKDFNKAPFSEHKYREALQIEELHGEQGYTTMERTGIRPALDVNGIWGGYTDAGSKTVIPSMASAKISMRLVPDQSYEQIGKLFEQHFRAIAPRSVRVNVRNLHGGEPYVSPSDLPAYRAAERAMQETFGKRPLPFYSGGSIPIISTFEKVLGIKSILLGFGLSEDAIHSPNESYATDNFYRGIQTIPLFYKYYSEMSSNL